MKTIELKEVIAPEIDQEIMPVQLTDETMTQRKKALLAKMQDEKLEALVIYADLEHGGNFEYLTGFVPRFEEAVLVLHRNGSAYMVLGNENLNKAEKARITAVPVHMPHFSLPNQPMINQISVAEILTQTKIQEANTIGLVGWKNFTSQHDENSALYELPYYVVVALQTICKGASFTNANHLFIGEKGLRTTNSANEIAHYEFGAMLASKCILDTMANIEVGMSEMALAETLSSAGQTHNVVTIMSTGERFKKANLYPTSKKIELGDRIAMTTSYKGGLQCRNAYAAYGSDDLPESERDYEDKVAKPYYSAIATWLETARVGITGKELYDTIETVLPKAVYGWSLNPGHLTADEEWMSSPVYPDSQEVLQSGMIFQIDIIPSVTGYSGVSCESGAVLADEALRQTIKAEYPEMWTRMEKRRNYLKEVLGINLTADILPMGNGTAFYRPYLLNKEMAFVCQ